MWTPHNKIPNTGRTSLVQTGGPKTVFETLFKYPRVVARHGGAPSVEARERFLTHCVSQGLAGATLLRHARELLVIAERIEITRGETIRSEERRVGGGR